MSDFSIENSWPSGPQTHVLQTKSMGRTSRTDSGNPTQSMCVHRPQ